MSGRAEIDIRAGIFLEFEWTLLKVGPCMQGLIFFAPFLALEQAANDGQGLSQLEKLHGEYIEAVGT